MPLRTTMLDLAKMSGNDKVIGLIEENQDAAPEFKKIHARTISGTTFNSLIRTGLPTVGFRKLNAGIDPSKSRWDTKLCQCFPLAGRVEIDKAIIKADPDGENRIKALEASGVVLASLLYLGTQFYYGQSDQDGFIGLQSLVAPTLVHSATGTTANGATSVYGVRTGDQGVQFVLGGGDVLNLGPFRDESLSDENGKKFGGEVADLLGFVGLQCVNKYAAGRIANITSENGKGVTDALIGEWLAKFPVGNRPNQLFMNRRGGLQLQKSRSNINAVGKKTSSGEENWAPMPEESNGIPIEITDSIRDDEPIIA